MVLLSRYFSQQFENTTDTKFHPLYTLLNKNYLGRRFTDHINDVFVQYKLLFEAWFYSIGLFRAPWITRMNDNTNNLL